MKLSKETIIGMFLANLVLTILVVIGVVYLMKEDRVLAIFDDRAPDAETPRVERADPEAEVRALEAENRLLALENSQKEILAKLDELKSGPGLAPGSGLVGAGEGEGDATAKVPEGGEAMMKLFGKMMTDRMQRERDRYIEMIQNPTPESEARQERMMRGMARRSARNLGLDEQQSVLLEEIVLDVDKMRRDQFLGLINSKSSPDQITKDEVTQILNDSFEEEDRRVEQSLPSDKATQYKKDAGAMRGVMTGMAGSMFGDGGEMK